MDDLQKMVSGVLENTPQGRSIVSAGSAITGLKKLPISNTRNFAGFTGPGRSVTTQPETEPVEIYELSVGQPDSESEGFVLASNDDRIGNILAIAEGSLEDANEEFQEVLNANLQEYIDATIAEYNSITEEEIEAAIEKAIAEDVEGARALSTHWSALASLSGSNWKASLYWSDFSIQKSPLLLTKWGQGSQGAYSTSGGAYNNYVKYKKGNDQYLTGCAPTAIAQIIAYHNYVKPNVPYTPASFNIANVGNWTGTYNLSLIRNLTTITNTSSAAAKGQVAALMYHIGLPGMTNAVYGEKGTGADRVYYKSTFEKFGYTVPTSYADATTLTETSSSSTFIYHTGLTTIKNALNNNRPILITGYNSGLSLGHAWVIDGYGSMTTYMECFNNAQTGQTYYVTAILTNCLMVHCNLGWSGKANGWYVYGIFDTGDRTLLETSSDQSGNHEFSAMTSIWIPQKP
ncbi:MAG: C10 family peptidase [Treponema sp.]|jgi:hypothetical protein|nr:C10 family peptidase [Treponema sp.]